MEANLPLTTTLASSLNSTANIFPMCPDILLVVTPVMTSHRKMERSPPEDANWLLSLDLEYIHPIMLYSQVHDVSMSYGRSNSHTDAQHFISMCSVDFYLCT